MPRSPIALLGLTIVLLVWAPSARAHEKTRHGSVILTIGWGDEPAFSGAKNYVEVDLTDARGAPVTDPGGSLAVEVSFAGERMTRPLVPSGEPGKFRAWLVPTRPGTYSFHITGRIKGETLDVTSTCSEKTFACVTDASEIQFPVKDPSAGQLAASVTRALPRVDRAVGTAASARTVAIVAIAVAALALATAVVFGLRKGVARV